VFELRDPDLWNDLYKLNLVNFINLQGCHLSWGRDATAGVGFPE
jgi:hypothetical protein